MTNDHAKKHLYNGKMYTIRELCEMYNLSSSGITRRLQLCRALDAPKNFYKGWLKKNHPSYTPAKLHMFRGKKRPVKEIAEKLKLTVNAIHKRIASGKSLDTPKQQLNTKYSFRGKKRLVKEIASMLKMTVTGIYNRIYAGNPLDAPNGFYEKNIGQNNPPKNFYMFRGKKRPVKEIAGILGISKMTVYQRIYAGNSLDVEKHKWQKNPRKTNPFYMFRGKERSVKEIAGLLGITSSGVYNRICKNHPLDCPNRKPRNPLKAFDNS